MGSRRRDPAARARVRRAMINAGSESPTETGPGYRRPAPRRRLLPIRRYTRSGRFNPNRSGGPLPIEPTPVTLPCSRTTPIRWTPPNGANPPSAMQARKHNDGRRKRTSRPTPIGGASTPAPPTPRRRRLGPSRDQHALSLSPCFRGAFASGCSRCGPVPRCAVLKPRQVLLPPASAAIGPSDILQPSGRLGVLHH